LALTSSFPAFESFQNPHAVGSTATHNGYANRGFYQQSSQRCHHVAPGHGLKKQIALDYYRGPAIAFTRRLNLL